MNNLLDPRRLVEYAADVQEQREVLMCIGGPVHGQVLGLDRTDAISISVPRPGPVEGVYEYENAIDAWCAYKSEYVKDYVRVGYGGMEITGRYWRWRKMSSEDGRRMAVGEMITRVSVFKEST